MKQRYRDLIAPLEAAGAYRDEKGRWHDPKGCMHGEANHCAFAMSVDPIETDPPRTRTMAQIRRESMALANRKDRGPGKEVRAVQYALAMNGVEHAHSANLYSWDAEKRCRKERAPDGTLRVRYVDDWEIPHWDFDPNAALVEERIAA